jgi:hypothetical protein
MIRTEAEYQEALRRAQEGRAFVAEERGALAAQGLTPEEVSRALEPVLSFQAQREDEVACYEAASQGR